MKQTAIILVPLTILYIVITVLVPPIVDENMNGVVMQPPFEVTAEALRIYDELEFIADLHCDALLWKRPMHERVERSHVDLVKMREARVSLEVFTVVSKSPKNLNFDMNKDNSDQITALSIVQGRSVNSWFNLKHRIGAQSRQLRSLEKKSEDSFQVIRSASDLLELIEANKSSFRVSGGLLGLEGAHPLKGRLSNIDYAYNKGVRMIGLVHFFDNELGGSAHGVEKGGLTDFGRDCIRAFEERGIIIDLAHASEALFNDVLQEATRPVIISHTGVKGTCNRGRNLSDEQIRGVARTGGIIGIAFFEETMCGMEPYLIAEGIRYVRDLVGIEHVALGSDFDGSVVTPFDITGLPVIVDELLKVGFTEEEIAKVMGENVRDFLLKHLPA
jgi:microsomal dipeptidase-like Zn-dependent dipeptidase